MNAQPRRIALFAASLVLALAACAPTTSYGSNDDSLAFAVGILRIVGTYAALQSGVDLRSPIIAPTTARARPGTCEVSRSACEAATARCRAQGGTCAIPCECGGN